MCPRAQQVATHALWTVLRARAQQVAIGPCISYHMLPIHHALAMPYLQGKVSNRAQNETSTRSGHTKHHAQQAQNHMTLMITPRRRNGRPRSRNRRTRSRPSKNRARKWQTLARKRGIQRWSSLLTAQSSRLAKANGMRQFLGERCWDDFVQYANTHYREAFLQAFTPQDGVLSCKGPLSPISGSTTCPQCFRVDVRQLGSSSQLQSKITSERLALMHVDHTYDVQHICTTWKSLSTPSPPCWDYGVCALKLCHLLFGTNATKDEEACLSFRCAVISTNSQCPCHHVARPHYEHTLQPS